MSQELREAGREGLPWAPGPAGSGFRVAPSFSEYLRLRGFDPAAGWRAFVSRMLFASWAQPGFRRFWQVWNPFCGFFLFRFYLALGGRRARPAATLAVFACSGFVVHDLIAIALFRRFVLGFTTAFFLYAVFALVSARLEEEGRSRTRPPAVRALSNAALVALGLLAGACAQLAFAELGGGR